MNQFQQSWALLKRCIGFLQENTDLFWLPVMSLIFSLIWLGLSASLAFYWHETHLMSAAGQETAIWGVIGAIVFVYVAHFIVLFFNVALLHCVMTRLTGQTCDLSSGMSKAAEHWKLLCAWTAITITVGFLIHLVERLHSITADLVAAVLNGGWFIATYFGLPYLVYEGIGPIAAIKKSLKLFGKSWRRVVSVNIVIIVPVILLFVIFYFIGKQLNFAPVILAHPVAIGSTMLLLILILSIVGGTFSSIIRSAMFLQFAEQQSVAAFGQDLLQQSIIKRKNALKQSIK